MKKNFVIAGVIILVMLGLCAAMGVVGWFSLAPAIRNGVHFGPLSVANFSATQSDQKSFSVTGQATLDLENYYGDIQVTAPLSSTAASGQIQVNYTKTAWGTSQALADQALKGISMSLTQDGSQVTVKVDNPQQPGLQINNRSPEVSFTVQVPHNTTVVIRTRTGAIDLTGTAGKADLNSDFGSIQVRNLQGGLFASSNNGEITVRDVKLLPDGNGDVTIKSQFGSITLDTVATTKVSASSNNGAVNFNQVTASGDVNLASDFGSLEYTHGQSGSLAASTKNGSVTLSNLAIDGKVTAGSDFGEINLKNVAAAAYDLHSNNGNITADKVSGPVKVTSDFGSIEITGGDQAVLDLETKNGSVTYKGSLGKSDQTFSTDFGEVTLTLPGNSAFDFDLKTDTGSIQSDLPMTMQGGLQEKHWKGTVNGGGSLLTATSRNGGITLKSYQP